VINRMNFFSCNALTEITIPAGVRYIGDGSFRFCDALRKITFEGVCPAIDMDCFSVLPEDAVAYVPDDQLEAYTAAFENAGSTVSVQPSGKNAVVVENNGYVEEEFDFDASTGTITSYNGYATYLAIPETIGGAPVKAIGPEAFASHSYLAFLELPEGLEAIGDSAFYNCETLGRVKFPSTLKTIGSNAFYNAYKSSVLELTSVESIGDYAFYFAGLKGSLELPEGLRSIGEHAFEACTNMGANLYLPATLETIGSSAFKGDFNIQYIVLNGLTPPALGEDVFKGCDYLFDIDLNAHGTRQEMQQWQAYVDALGLPCRVWRAQDPTAQSPEKGAYRYENRVLIEYTGTRTRIHPHLTVSKEPVVGLGDGVFKDSQAIEYFSVAHNDEFTTIGAEAFMNSSLREVDLFDSVTTIGARAFAGCAQLEELTLPDSLTTIGEGALDGLTGLKKLVIKCDPALIPAGVFANMPNLSEVTIESGAVPAHMFAGSGVKALTLGEGVTEIGESAFADTLLSAADLKHVTAIGAGAFANTAMTSVELPQAAAIGEGAFEGSALESVRLSAAASVGERAFANTKLKQLVIPTAGSFPLSAVEGTSVELRLPADATDAQLAAWNETLECPWYDPMLREGEVSKFVKMPFDPTPAENFEFDPETGLISAYIGTDVDVVVPREIDGVTVVGFKNYNAFDSCQDYTDSSVETNRTEWVHLRTLVLPETIKELPGMMLAYCQQLETFVCYAPLESTGGNQFMLCRSLNNVIFVNGVREIGNYAFDSAGPLGNLYFGEHLVKIGQQAFNFAGLTSFVADAESVEYGAFAECQCLTSLHFTARMKSFGENCIVNCPNLAEICFDGCDLTTSPMGLMMNVAPRLTVRVPADMSGENLKRAQKCVSWNSSPVEVTVSTEGCSHTLPALPDVTALLPELKLDASVEAAATVSPETTAEPETTPEPIDEPAPESTAAPENTPEAQSAAIPEKYLGVWYGVSMEMEGVSYPLADMGMELTLTISADGAAEMNMNGEVERFQCAVRDGVLTEGAKTLTLQEGMLQFSEGSAAMLMSREKPEGAAEAPAPVDKTATLDSFKGVWTASRVSAEGLTLPAAAADMAGDTLTIYGDTCDLTLSGYLLDGLPCHMDGHRLIFTLLDGECAVTRHTDGTLSLMLEEASVWYEYTGEAPEAPAIPTQEPMPEPTAEPMTEPTAAPAPAAPGAASMVGRKFVMTDADVSGYNMSAAMMGGFEYSILLREDGNVEFVMAGANIPSLTWSYGKVPTDSGEADGIVIAYPGQLLYLVPTEQGFDMDYFGTMLMHFAPEA
ncbi:MAG: leucine-rich repeat protein, partial [Candidatus Ventricola sp.]|nr:leucine-rich repeat protein [Candidatus Ventricola sp.]